MEKRTTFSILFYIKKTKTLKNGEVPIYLRIIINKERLDLALNRSIYPDQWNSETGAAYANTKESKMINSYI